MPVKKQPIRQCTGCREHRPKKELLRVVRTPTGEITWDPKGKMSGRGAYICPEPVCLAKARKTRVLERHLGASIAAEVYDALAVALTQKENGVPPDGL